MKRIQAKAGFSILLTVFFLLSTLVGGIFASDWDDNEDFEDVVKSIMEIPYNPRPLFTDTADVTGISEDDSRTLFLSTFTRVLIPAPANGYTFQASDPENHLDITLVGFLGVHGGPDAIYRPGIVLTHGGVGQTSLATQSQFLIHIANVLFANGYHVLTVERREGPLSRCAYQEGSLDPDPLRSLGSFGGTPSTWNCNIVHPDFRDPSFTPNTLMSGFGAFGSGDLLAAAKYLKEASGAKRIGALSGSIGGFVSIWAASIQDRADNDFDPGLLDALLVLSPWADYNTHHFTSGASGNLSGACLKVGAAEVYSGIAGSGIRDFAIDPQGAVEDLFGLFNGVEALQKVKIPVFIVQTLTDDQTFIHGALAYKAKTDKMDLADTLFLAHLGHFSQLWQTDPFWMDKVVLTYFKQLLARNIFQIGANPGFSSLGPNPDNPLIVKLEFKNKDVDKFLVQESVVPYLVGLCAGL